jgi:hypothetical protein
MKTDRLFIILALLLSSSVVYSQPREKKRYLPEAKIEREDFILLMDSVVCFEKKCDYYTDSIPFMITFIVNPDDSSMYMIEIGSSDRIDDCFSIDDNLPIAFYRIKNHVCLLYNELPEFIFSIANEKTEFVYKDYFEFYRNSDAIMWVDDGFTGWRYYFYDNEFHFDGKYTFCQ